MNKNKIINRKTILKQYNLFRAFSFLLKIFLVNLISIKNERNLNNYISEIHLIIKGKGKQNILSDNFNANPSGVIVNGIFKGDTCGKTCDLGKDVSDVTVKFEEQVESCYHMFYRLQNIIEIDLSNFDASKVNNMEGMFDQCTNLEKINFGNINTSSVKIMYGLFNYCEKLISIDLSNFDTSKVSNMQNMFGYCKNLEKINFGNINTSSVKNMYGLFYNCSKLISIDLSNFDTSKVSNMQNMFGYCNKLKYLDLSNFDTSNLTNIGYMFYKCQSLIYLNLNSFHFKNSVIMDSIFEYISSYVKICANDEKILTKLQEKSKSSDCYDICFTPNIKIDIESNQCIESCLNNKYELNNICYNECPKDSFPISDDELDISNFENIKKCYDKTPEGYYLDINNKIYKKCFKNCKYCYGEGDETINNCKECNDNFTFINDSIYKNNCYQKCNHYYYFDESNNFQCTETCPEKYKLIREKNKCVEKCENDDTYIYEYNNICYINCPYDAHKIEDAQEKICYNITPNGYYLDNNNDIYKKCYETCNKCDIGGNISNHNCLECKNNYTFYNNSIFISNCYEICNFIFIIISMKQMILIVLNIALKNILN